MMKLFKRNRRMNLEQLLEKLPENIIGSDLIVDLYICKDHGLYHIGYAAWDKSSNGMNWLHRCSHKCLLEAGYKLLEITDHRRERG